ncbi:MAG: hypothetical protein ABDH63_07665, partial [Candidatus Caldarchaeales archaeon]
SFKFSSEEVVLATHLVATESATVRMGQRNKILIDDSKLPERIKAVLVERGLMDENGYSVSFLRLLYRISKVPKRPVRRIASRICPICFSYPTDLLKCCGYGNG